MQNPNTTNPPENSNIPVILNKKENLIPDNTNMENTSTKHIEMKKYSPLWFRDLFRDNIFTIILILVIIFLVVLI